MKSFVLFAVFAALILIIPSQVYAHEDGCHILHSCESHDDEYVCGDLGRIDECPIDKEEAIPLLTIESNRDHYKYGDSIIVFGKVGSVLEEYPVTFQVFRDSITNLIEVGQVKVALDGTYSTIFVAGGENWNKKGNYFVSANYHTATKEVHFTLSLPDEEFTKSIFEVDAGTLGSFDVEYFIRGGIIDNITLDTQNLGFKIDIITIADGEISLEIPREWVGAVQYPSERDEDFIILIDGQEVSYIQTASSNDSRIIKFDFLNGDKEIQVIGTYAIPEFGVIAVLILITGIIAIVLLTRKKSKLFVIN